MRLNLLHIFFFSILLITSSACDSTIDENHRQEEETPVEGPEVYLSITKAQAAGLESINSDGVDYEDRVHDLCMLVFDSSTGEKVCEFFDENIPFADKEKTFTVKMNVGLRDFYFIANMPMNDLRQISNKSAMINYLNVFRILDSDLYLNARESKGFPMSRVYLNQAVTEGGNIYSPKRFYPDGEERIRLIRVVAKLEVKIDGAQINSGVKNIYYKNAYRQFCLSQQANLTTVQFYEDKPLKKTGNSFVYYMPEAIITDASWSFATDHKPVNYFLIETLEGAFYKIPIITDDRTITDTNYLAFATGQQAEKPDYNIYRNRHYYYVIKNLQIAEIIYNIDPWQINRNTCYMGYGYNVVVEESGRVTISNTIEACLPHTVKLQTVEPIKFSDDTIEKSFMNQDADASAEYILNPIPNAGYGAYLQVYYNGILVKTFSR